MALWGDRNGQCSDSRWRRNVQVFQTDDALVSHHSCWASLNWRLQNVRISCKIDLVASGGDSQYFLFDLGSLVLGLVMQTMRVGFWRAT